jgi:hypothetical protein
VRQAVEDHPAQGPGWGPERQIRSQVIHQLLSGRGDLDESFDTPAAVRLRGAAIVGRRPRVPREGTTRISPAGGEVSPPGARQATLISTPTT